MTAQRADCAVCDGAFAVKADGALRRHPRGAPVPCPGSDQIPGWVIGDPSSADPSPVPPPPPAPAEPAPAAEPPPTLADVVLTPGIYRAAEPMMTDVVIPRGHVAVQITAVYPWLDPTRTAEQEAALLFEVPDYLQRVLDSVPNDRIKVALKVPDPWRAAT